MQKLRMLFKTPTLKRIGFEIATASGSKSADSSKRWKIIDSIFRHPAVLILLTSILSIGVGNWLTSVYQERQRARDAVVRSMDDLRSSVDDLSLAADDYVTAAAGLIGAMEADLPPEQLIRVRTNYDAASIKWKSKSFVDLPNIRQRMPGGRGPETSLFC
ncbi:hypothetical protein PQR05_37435 [Paraburkholderia sediminicola]|uniref:hypothetical protein n=1 Tax=Paraburkholderia sediminicola TaxID=458836 RepID=UPI0038BA34F2